MSDLKGSVGKGGVNSPNDVITIQTLLKNAGAYFGKVDGSCGPKTILAITDFQKKHLPLGDGRVDPNGTTWRKLKGGLIASGPPVSGLWSGDSSLWPQDKKLRSLDPLFRPKVQSILEKLKGCGFQPKVHFGWRSVQVQEQLYREGKSKLQFSFHNAQKPDGTPNAYAADIIDQRWGWEDAAKTHGYWKALGLAARNLGLVWGGDWKDFPDEAHVQSRQNSELAAVKKESGL